MSAPADYLLYPNRRLGNEHAFYPWSNSFDRDPLQLPDGKRVALVVVPVLEWFPLNMQSGPVKPIGQIDGAYPDIWPFTVREYGNRIGIYRLLRLLERMGARGSIALNAAIAQRYPVLTRDLVHSGAELIAHGLDMENLHHSLLEPEAEREMIARSFSTLRDITGTSIDGWHSPAFSESARTLEFAAAAGASFALGWANDDLPYEFSTQAGTLVMVPTSYEMDDASVIREYGNSARNFATQITQAYERFSREGGRVLTVMLHAWISGQAMNIQAVEDSLLAIARNSDCWVATAGEIADLYRKQTDRGQFQQDRGAR